eukprot:m.120001 g.120001  ORF g.120001 m.120001 type:complete len:390 (-) comp28780_c0_seq1:257-1426(-)
MFSFQHGVTAAASVFVVALTSSTLAAPRPHYVSSEPYPVFWHVGGKNSTVFGPPGGIVNVKDYEMKPLNFSFCGGIGGKWPMLPEGLNGTVVNGGVPQAANLSLHLELTAANVERLMPDPAYAGLGIFDFEAWFPIWEDNTSGDDWHGSRYQTYSILLVKKEHPDWTDKQLEDQATSDFETAGIAMFVQTLNLCSKLRPNALWGFYGMPGATFPSEKMLPVWEASGALFPSIYLESPIGAEIMIGSAVSAAVKVAEKIKPAGGYRIPVYPFAWECYHSGKELLSPANLKAELLSPYSFGADGLVIWGSTSVAPQGGGGKNMSAYLNFFRTETGPLVKSFEDEVLACGKTYCSNQGRCVQLTNITPHPSCRCFDGFTGVTCDAHTHTLIG